MIWYSSTPWTLLQFLLCGWKHCPKTQLSLIIDSLQLSLWGNQLFQLRWRTDWLRDGIAADHSSLILLPWLQLSSNPCFPPWLQDYCFCSSMLSWVCLDQRRMIHRWKRVRSLLFLLNQSHHSIYWLVSLRCQVYTY